MWSIESVSAKTCLKSSNGLFSQASAALQEALKAWRETEASSRMLRSRTETSVVSDDELVPGECGTVDERSSVCQLAGQSDGASTSNTGFTAGSCALSVEFPTSEEGTGDFKVSTPSHYLCTIALWKLLLDWYDIH